MAILASTSSWTDKTLIESGKFYPAGATTPEDRLRFYGTWNHKGLKASSQRFDYDYDDKELKDIGGEVQKIARKVETTHVLFNNNYHDQAQRGARALTNILGSGVGPLTYL